LTGEEQRRVSKHYTENAEAYTLYIKGYYFLNKRTAQGMKKSIEYFQQAIEKDPNYALAWAGLADSYSALPIRANTPPQDLFQAAKAAAMRALEIDETIAEAHASLANVKYSYDWDWSGAEGEFKRAIELNPNYSVAHQSYASYLISTGRHEQAISEAKRVQALDPLSLFGNVQMARIFYFAGRYDEAVAECLKALEMDSNYGVARLFLGKAYRQKGMYKEALAELEKAKDLLEDDSEVLSQIGYTYAVWGRRVEAQKVLEELQESSKQSYVSPYHIAMVYAGLGQRDKTFEWLEMAYERREARMNILKFAPEFDGLHSDPRYADLVRRVGLQP
jgi:tetratricopeptide (TPR) repeat protein